MLLAHQGALRPRDLAGYAGSSGSTSSASSTRCAARAYADRVSEDVASADESGVSGTPTFFINGRRHYGVYDIATLTEAVRAAKRRARALTPRSRRPGAAAARQSATCEPMITVRSPGSPKCSIGLAALRAITMKSFLRHGHHARARRSA